MWCDSIARIDASSMKGSAMRGYINWFGRDANDCKIILDDRNQCQV